MLMKVRFWLLLATVIFSTVLMVVLYMSFREKSLVYTQCVDTATTTVELIRCDLKYSLFTLYKEN